MRFLTTLVVVSAAAQTLPFPGPKGPAGAAPTSICRPIVVDNAKVPNTDQTNFRVTFRSPVGTVTTITTAVTRVSGDSFPSWLTDTGIMINGVVYTVSSVTNGNLLTLGSSAGTQGSPVAYSGTPFLALLGSGGEVLDAQGDDIVFFSDSGCTSIIPFYSTTWDSQTGVGTWKVKKTLTTASDTTFYIGTGNSSYTTSQQNIAGVNDGITAGIWHFPDGTTLTALDYSGNANNGTLVNTPTAVADLTGDGAASLVEASDSHVTVGTGASLDVTAITVIAWVNPTSLPNAYNTLVNKSNGSQFNNFYVKSDGNTVVYIQASGLVFWDNANTAQIAPGTWYQIAYTYSSGTNLSIWVNGIIDMPPQTANGAMASNNGTGAIGTDLQNANRNWDGPVGDVQVDNAVRSEDYLVTQYNNISSPFTFFSIGAVI